MSKLRAIALSVFAAPLLFVSATNASAQGLGLGGGAHVGTMGVGLHAYFAPAELFSFTGTVEGFNLEIETSGTVLSEEIRNLADSTVFNSSAMVNLHPLGNGFKLSGGFIGGMSKVEGSGARAFDYDSAVNGPQSVDGTFTMEASFKNAVAPYVGLGYQKHVDAGLSFYGDLGLAYTGGYEASGTFALDCASQAAVDRPGCELAEDEGQAEYQDLLRQVDDLEYYPVLRAGISYKF